MELVISLLVMNTCDSKRHPMTLLMAHKHTHLHTHTHITHTLSATTVVSNETSQHTLIASKWRNTCSWYLWIHDLT